VISVIIPARNSEKTIKASIDSVIDQGVEDIEIICIINGTTDDTESVVRSIGDKRIRILYSSPGIVSALNEGLRNAKGDIIARQDADDIWLDGKLKSQIEFLEKNLEIDVVGTQMEVVDVSGNRIRLTNYPKKHEEIVRSLLSAENSIGHPSVVFRKRILDKCAGYFDLFPFAEDMDLWIRCIPWFKMANLEKIYVKYEHKPNPKYDGRVPQILASWYRKIYGLS
jgi:glycosyltransferase involved in cell wall biosynthesis